MNDFIKIKGARQHNLKNISINIPKNQLVVITGLSGSGKSSLAFDTIYAEGQRRYVESLSAYARQFLGIMEKPDVDLIEGLSPAIAIDQKKASHNPRSTVGTITEVYDYLRLLFARIGHPHCPKCGLEVVQLTVDEINQRIISQIKDALNKEKIKPIKFLLLAPVIREKKGEFNELFKNLQSKGFNQIKIDNQLTSLKNNISLIKTNKHSISVVLKDFLLSYHDIKIDNLLDKLKIELKLIVEQGLSLTNGLIILQIDQKEYLYSEHYSCPNCNQSLPELEPRMFSFNSPMGACPKCHGLGTIYQVDPELILNKNLSINEGAIIPFSRFFYQDTWYLRLLKTVCHQEGIKIDIPLNQISQEKINALLFGTNKVYQVFGKNRFGKETVIYEKFNGLIKDLESRLFENNSFDQTEYNRYVKEKTCSTCQGTRLKNEVLSVTIDSKNIAEVSHFYIQELSLWLNNLSHRLERLTEIKICQPIIKEIQKRLDFLNDVGLGYLRLDRRAESLSGGERQRIRLASQIGSGLTGVLYVLDEPSIGLHPRDINALINSLKKLRDLGNSLIVVEHDEETIRQADYIIELGPLAGKNGGKVTFQGRTDEILKQKNSLTGAYLSGSKKIDFKQKQLNKLSGQIILRGVRTNNLKNITVKIPLGNLIAVTGVSGSGKSSLITDTLYPALKYYLDGFYQKDIGLFDRLEGYQYLDRIYLVDQSPIGRTPRSNVATYIGFFDDIRDLFASTIEAKAYGFNKGRFSFNVKGGRCEKCQGAGVIKVEMQFLADLYIKCDLCQGRRYNEQTLEIKFKGKSIDEILNMTVDEAIFFFANYPRIIKKLTFLKKVGLGYITLGQGAPTFSGGEAQRIKIAGELTKKTNKRTLFLLDEPTTGLHFDDVKKLITVLKELVDRGDTVIVIEHNLDVIRNSQYLIDLGPEGGEAGGYLVFQGEINKINQAKNSFTAEYLKKYYKL